MALKREEDPSQVSLFEKIAASDSQSRAVCPDRNAAEVAQAIQGKGWAFLRVSGKSMFPWICEKDVVFLRRVRVADVVPGDVVVFERNGALCMHRVLSADSGAAEAGAHVALITKGDATADLDGPVSTDEFRGKVEFVYRRNREIGIDRGWRKLFGNFLAFVSPATRWWRPVASMLSRSTRCEPLGVQAIEVRRPSENSVD